MKTTTNVSQFKPSTYGDNVSEPLLERIKALEQELQDLRKQVKTLKFEQALRRPQLSAGTSSLPRINDKGSDQLNRLIDIN